MMNVLKPGTKVILNPDGEPVDAEVLESTITHQGIYYTIVWWAGRERKEQRFADGEIRVRPSKANFVRIGFSNQG